MAVGKRCNCCGHYIGVFQSWEELPALCERCNRQPSFSSLALMLAAAAGFVAAALAL